MSGDAALFGLSALTEAFHLALPFSSNNVLYFVGEIFHIR